MGTIEDNTQPYQSPIRVTEFKLWLMEKGIRQNALKETTRLAIGTLHRCINYGDATPKTIKLITISLNDDFGVTITEHEIEEMLAYKV